MSTGKSGKGSVDERLPLRWGVIIAIAVGAGVGVGVASGLAAGIGVGVAVTGLLAAVLGH